MYFHTACLIIHIQLQNHTGDLALGACLSLVQNLNPRLKSFITARRRHTIYFSANLPFSICLTCMFNTSAISAVFVFFCCWLFPECFAYYNHWKRSVLRRTVIITEIDNFRYTIVLRVFFLSIILFFCSLLTLLAIMKCSKKEEIGKKNVTTDRCCRSIFISSHSKRLNCVELRFYGPDLLASTQLTL